MGCCSPSTCFTCKENPQSDDACMCGCGYLNGPCAITVAQFFTCLGLLLSVATLADCSFAKIDKYRFNFIGGVDEIAEVGIGVGFLTFQTQYGQCYLYNDTSQISEWILQKYWTILGQEWATGFIIASFCVAFAWYIFWYSVSFCCSSQVKFCRYLNGFFLAVVLVVLQGCTFLVFGSTFCKENNCVFSRTAGYSIAAMVCYMIAGIGFFLSSDYPGPRRPQGEEIQDATNNVVVYHEDPELTRTEYAEAKRISERLGGYDGSTVGTPKTDAIEESLVSANGDAQHANVP